MAIDEFDFIHKYFANLNSAFDGQARKNGASLFRLAVSAI